MIALLEKLEAKLTNSIEFVAIMLVAHFIAEYFDFLVILTDNYLILLALVLIVVGRILVHTTLIAMYSYLEHTRKQKS
jgi:hypothetical protein